MSKPTIAEANLPPTGDYLAPGAISEWRRPANNGHRSSLPPDDEEYELPTEPPPGWPTEDE